MTRVSVLPIGLSLMTVRILEDVSIEKARPPRMPIAMYIHAQERVEDQSVRWMLTLGRFVLTQEGTTVRKAKLKSTEPTTPE